MAIDFSNDAIPKSKQKWVESGKGYSMYTRENNCLMKFAKNLKGYPHSVAAKEDKIEKTAIGFSESDLKTIFKFH